jgi:AcrR family transcriptional regulator
MCLPCLAKVIHLTSTNGRAYNNTMTKGKDTKETILSAGLEMASHLGLENVTIGALAKSIHMSKSGVFAHFQSKENLQIQILEYAGERFAETVILPVLKEKAGITRIRALVANWIEFSMRLTGGCIFVSASSEFSDRPGRVRDFLLAQQGDWMDGLRRVAHSAVLAGDFREDIDIEQFAFDLYSLLLGFYYYHQLLQDAKSQTYQESALDQLLKNYR